MIWRSLTACLFLLLGAGSAAAQPTIGVYFDPEGTQTSKQIFSYPTDFTFYVVAKGLDVDFKSFEFGLDYTTTGFGNVWWGPNGTFELMVDNATNVCTPEWNDYCVAVSPCASGASQPIAIASVTLEAFDQVEDYTICLGVNSMAHGPAFVACNETSSQSFRSPYAGCAVLNPVQEPIPVGTAASSWGRVKALYGN